MAARVGQGLGGALVAPTGLSILATTFAEGRERNRALASWGTLGGLGGASGAIVGGLVTEALSWRWVMLAGTPICLGAAVAALYVVPAGARRGRTFDLPGACAATAGLVVLTYGVVAVERRPLMLAGGAALLGLFLVIEGRSRRRRWSRCGSSARARSRARTSSSSASGP